jgi:FemAB-related protein (PEP-CTERM system-associated)
MSGLDPIPIFGTPGLRFGLGITAITSKPAICWRSGVATGVLSNPPEMVSFDSTLEMKAVASGVEAIHIQSFTDIHAAAWDGYVRAHPSASPFHLIAWQRTIVESFGYEPKYLVALQGDTIRGVLPLFLVQNLLIGKALISTPFAVYGGVLADGPEILALFRDAVTELGKKLEVGYVELRNIQTEQRLGFSPISAYVTFGQTIGPDEEAILETIPRKTRAAVRKSLKAGLISRTSTSMTRKFLELYSINLRKLGTPCFPYKYFYSLMKNFAGSIDVREVMSEGNVAAAVVTFYFRDQVLPYYGASDPAFNALAPNNYMYFDLMRTKGKEGYGFYDFGRSKKYGSGSHDFKSHWGMVERELPYEILLVKRKNLPNYAPTNKAFEWPLKIWRKLPLPVTRWIGPIFLRLVP